MRRKPGTVTESGAIDPDKTIEVAIEEYKRRGKSDEWIQARLLGKVKREMVETLRKYYGVATTEIYLGLWN